jgi:aspartokinase/homoserine dehydrogenase 1
MLNSVKVYKFGGSLLKTADDIKLIAKIIKKENNISIFSAFFGITDALIKVAKIAESGLLEYEMQLDMIRIFHINICKELKIDYLFVKNMFDDLSKILNTIYQVGDLSLKTLDKIMSFGELLSSKIICSYLDLDYIDARDIIKTDSNYGNAKVNMETTTELINNSFDNKKTYIVPGFIASDDKGFTTTLGRNGSDYSAALITSILNAGEVTVWKDVNGLSTANPKIVPSAIQIDKISYKEMAELSYFGNKIISLQALTPVINKNIKIILRSIYNLENKGTIISSETNKDYKIKGITNIDDITLVSVNGFNMVGISGFSKRVFESLSKVNVSVIFIAQSSSEISISFGIRTVDLEKAKLTLKDEFKKETIIDVKIKQSLIAVAGYGMANTSGTVAKIFRSLAKADINISAIAQDFGEMNVSFAVNASDSELAVKVIHDYLFENKKLNLLILGNGVVGSAVIKMLENPTLKDKFNVGGICNTKEFNGVPYKDYDEVIKKFKDKSPINCVLIDCTASDIVVDNYKKFIENKFDIVTSNKKANTLPFEKLNALRDIFKKNKRNFFFETNVGAGLPIISTIQDLINCGDKIIKIEGIFSGTLSYIFNNFSANKKFSDIVLEAKKNGFTEPNPNDDLCGMDVARKLLIIARMLNLNIDLKDIEVQNLVDMKDDDFLKLQKENTVLRYIGKIENNKVEAKLQAINNDSPLASTQYTDNIISITSKYYNKTPLIIKGPGAGAEVTAVGVISDLLKLWNF